MRIISFLYLLILCVCTSCVSESFGGSSAEPSVYESSCRDEVVKICDRVGGETPSVCTALRTQGKDEFDSVHEFLYRIRDISSEQQRLFICARLMGQSFTYKMTEVAEHVSLYYETAYLSGYYDSSGGFFHRKYSYEEGMHKFDWSWGVHVEPSDLSCVKNTVESLSELRITVQVEVTSITSEARINKIFVENTWCGSYPDQVPCWKNPLDVDIFLEPVRTIELKTNYSDNGFAGTCAVLREKLRTERERLLNSGLR